MARYSLAASAPRPALASAGQLGPQLTLPGAIAGIEAQGQPVEFRGAVEGQGLRRPGGGFRIMLAGLPPLLGLVKMARQGLRIGLPPGLENGGQTLVVMLQHGPGQMRRDGLADAVVVGLDLVLFAQARTADEAAGLQHGGHVVPLCAEVRRLAEQVDAQGLAGHGDHSQKTLRLFRQFGNTVPENFVQSQRMGALEVLSQLGTCLQILHQLVNEKGISSRLLFDRLRLLRGHLALLSQQFCHQSPGIRRTERLQGKLTAIQAPVRLVLKLGQRP